MSFDIMRSETSTPVRRADLLPKFGGKHRKMKVAYYTNAAACSACVLKSRCTNSRRSIARYEKEEVPERLAVRLRARPELVNGRREIVEHPFGTIKQWMGQGAFLMQGREKVQGEVSFTALAYNMRRALNIVGMRALVAALPV